MIHRGFVAVTRWVEITLILLATHPDHAGEEPQGDWFMALQISRLRRMERQLRVDTAGVHAMATRWGAAVGDLNEVVAPTGLGLSCQNSAAAVDAAHAAVAAFSTGLAARVGERATGVTQAQASYLAQEATSSTALAAALNPVVGE